MQDVYEKIADCTQHVREARMALTDGRGTPDPSPRNIMNWCFLIYFNCSYIFLNWLSGALVGVGGSDFIVG